MGLRSVMVVAGFAAVGLAAVETMSAAVAAPPARLGGLPVVFLKSAAAQQPALAAQASDLGVEFGASRIDFCWRGSRIYLTFPGSAKVSPEAGAPLVTRVNYFTGSDPSSWRREVPTYAGVTYRNLYPGVDMVYGAEARHLKSEFVVAPGADPDVIRLRYFGVLRLRVAEDGSLRALTSQGELREGAPFVYQLRNGVRNAVPARYRIDDAGDVSFELGSYDADRTLWIDPSVSYSTFAGSTRVESATAVAAGAGGETYVAGWAESSTFPGPAPARAFSGSVDAWVMKLSADGATVLYTTFLGGSGDDRALGLDVDSSGNAYVTGYTTSNNFPTFFGIQNSRAGGRDAFVVKLNPQGSTILFSTYFGGGANDTANGIAVDSFGQPYVAGETESWNFPLRFPFQTSLKGGRDAFTFKIGLTGALSYSTYLGGSGEDRATSIAVSDTLTPYVAGCSTSLDFPLRRAIQGINGGGQDGFVVRFNGDANDMVYSTYLGGNGGAVGSQECVNSIAVDAFKNAYVAGVTSSKNFPVLTPFQSQFGGGGQDAFVAKLDSGGARLYSSYLGGRSLDAATSIRVDSARRAYVAGYTASINFPMVSAIQPAFAGTYDIFVSRVETAGTSMSFSTFLGGLSSDTAAGLALHVPGSLSIAGLTASTNFPLVSPVQTVFGGATDSLVIKLGGF